MLADQLLSVLLLDPSSRACRFGCSGSLGVVTKALTVKLVLVEWKLGQ